MTAVPIRDAATVVLLRRDAAGAPRVLMGMRGAGAAFMPSKFVFPGGAADPCDGNLIDCARRELREETGLTVAAGAAFLLFFRAITPPGRPRRFDARFFLVDAAHIEGEPDDFSRAEPELSHLQWVPLNTAAQLDLPFITEVVLAEVAQLAGTDGALRVPGEIPFFDNSGDTPRFRTLPG